MADLKLYYTSTSCGAASFITATIGGVDFDSETVDLRSHKTKSGADFFAINPKGNVPTVVLGDGSILTENVAALTYLADKGSADLAPKEGTTERYQYLNNVGFVTSELHQSFGPFFNPQLTNEAREAATANLMQRLGKLTTLLGGQRFLDGKALSAADIYAYIVLSWAGFLNVTLPDAAQAYVEGLRADKGIQEGHAAMAARE